MQLQNPKAFPVIVIVVAVGGEILLATCLSPCTFQTVQAGGQAGKHTQNAMQQAEMYFSADAAGKDIQLPSRLSEIKRKSKKIKSSK